MPTIQRESSVGVGIRVWAEQMRNYSSIRGKGEEIFLSFQILRQNLRTTQPPNQWLKEALSTGLGGRGVKLTTHLRPVPRSGMSGALLPLRQYFHGVDKNNIKLYILLSVLTTIFPDALLNYEKKKVFDLPKEYLFKNK